jgi:hypothetical protein
MPDGVEEQMVAEDLAALAVAAGAYPAHGEKKRKNL